MGALSRTRLAKGTQRSYGYGIALFARWLEQAGGALETLAESDIRSYKNHLKTVLLRRPATINQQMNVVRWLCRWAQGRGMLKGDLVAGAELDPVPPRRRPVGLTEAEVHGLLRAAGQGRPSQRARDYALVQILLQTGLLVSELTTLRVGDVTIHERSGVVRVRKGREREVPLNITTRRAIRAYLDTRPEVESEEPLFLSQQRRALSERMVQHLLGSLSMRARLETAATPQRLRHTFALTYLREHPDDVGQLRQLLGHESTDATATYTLPPGEEPPVEGKLDARGH